MKNTWIVKVVWSRGFTAPQCMELGLELYMVFNRVLVWNTYYGQKGKNITLYLVSDRLNPYAYLAENKQEYGITHFTVREVKGETHWNKDNLRLVQ